MATSSGSIRLGALEWFVDSPANSPEQAVVKPVDKRSSSAWLAVFVRASLLAVTTAGLQSSCRQGHR